MKKVLVLFIAIATVFAMGASVFAAEVPEDEVPVAGSWTLCGVFETSGEEAVLLEKEEAQSVYGAGISIFTFDTDGFGHIATFDAGDMVDLDAEWKSAEPNVYSFTEKDGMEYIFTYDPEAGLLHRSFEDENPDAMYKALDFVYARPIVGTWKLDQVKEIHEGDSPVILEKEENQSLYASAENEIIFAADGTGKEVVKDGADSFEQELTWVLSGLDEYTVTSPDAPELVLYYSRVDDALFYDVKDDAADAAHPHLRFALKRAQ